MTEPTKPDPVEALVASVRAGQEASNDQTKAVMEVLRVWLGRRRLDPHDREEVCAEAVVRLIDVTRRDALDPSRPPGAWVRVVADHLAIDALRRTARSPSVEFDEQRHAGASEDDQLAALLDRSAAASDIRRAIREAGDADEMDIVQVVATWIGLAAANGQAPSSREVGARLGISHMTVQRALRSFGQRLSR